MKETIRENDYYYDNIKFILIFIVIVGHYCEKYNESVLLNAVFTFIYSFHMPLFIFLSGYFSKGVECQRFKDVKMLLIPYLIIQTLYLIILTFTNPKYVWSLAIPIGATWYLLGLFLWRLLAPYFNQIKYPIIFSVLIGLFVGFIADMNVIFNLQRIFTYLPFFIVGYVFNFDYKQKLLFKNRSIGLLIFIVFAFIIFFSFNFPEFVSYLKSSQLTLYPFSGDSTDKVSQFSLRILFYIVAVINSILFMQLIPSTKTWYSHLGRRSLYVFLFHMFFIYILDVFIPYKMYITELLTVPISFFLLIFLSNKIITSILEKILYPWKVDLTFKIRHRT